MTLRVNTVYSSFTVNIVYLKGKPLNMLRTTAPGINPSDETISVRGLTIRFLLTGDDSSGSVAAFEMTVPGGQSLPAPTHSHDCFEETIYGITGELTLTVDGNTFEIGPGQALCIPRGAVHRFDNNTAEDAKTLCVITPAALGPQYFREMAELLQASASGPPDRAKALDIMLRHGLKPAAPPA